MKFISFEKDGKLALGLLTAGGILDLGSAAQKQEKTEIPETIMELILKGEAAINAVKQIAENIPDRDSEVLLEETNISFGPSVTDPQKIICVGLNYRKHAEESGMAPPEFPLLFSKFSNTLSSHKQQVKITETIHQVDYEAELAIVIGKEGQNIKEEDALDYVFGYSCSNDLSARDLQFKSSQWLLGKTLDGFCPLGPYLVTADEIHNPNNLGIKTYVNGELRQDSNTSDMIFNCKEIISYVSQYMTLYPGDVILTGTPEGVIMGLPEEKKEWLKDGDTIEVVIEGLGSLETRIVR
ncbi:fumarylacetoacetate hydrolase family protein [Bacillaceae bacterium C204]|uniref:fumarylacetoacetate hydrolase family protein n=1 Tax=Neobacillus sp. 204 TaxID=3383351 RepID=UPI00397BF0E4